MRKTLAALAAAAALTVPLTASPATAADSDAVTRWEFMHAEKDMTPHQVAELFGMRGTRMTLAQSDTDAGWTVRYYPDHRPGLSVIVYYMHRHLFAELVGNCAAHVCVHA